VRKKRSRRGDGPIEFEPKKAILRRARDCLESVETFLDGRGHSVPLLLKALRLCEGDFKREIMLLLGSFAKEDVAWPLYEILSDPCEDEGIRNQAAIQLSLICPCLKEPQAILDRLLEDMASPDPELRLHATFAVGWKGNVQAAIPIIERLYDTDLRVQQAAVNALANLEDDRILNMLLERLEHGPLPQKRCILMNLWRFQSKREEVTAVYLRYLGHEDPDLRLEALALLAHVAEVRDHLFVYRRCLRDSDERIRLLALRRLGEEEGGVLDGLRGEIEGMVQDRDMSVKRAALEILKRA
jgi:HEAT repeat protein